MAKPLYPNALLTSFNKALGGIIECDPKPQKFLEMIRGTSYTVAPNIRGAVFFPGYNEQTSEWVLPFYHVEGRTATIAYYLGILIEFSSSVPSAIPDKVGYRFYLEREVSQYRLSFRAELDVKSPKEHAQPHWHYHNLDEGAQQTVATKFEDFSPNEQYSTLATTVSPVSLLSQIHYCMAWHATGRSCPLDHAHISHWMEDILNYTKGQMEYAYQRL